MAEMAVFSAVGEAVATFESVDRIARAACAGTRDKRTFDQITRQS
jgi:hypothetical protein